MDSRPKTPWLKFNGGRMKNESISLQAETKILMSAAGVDTSVFGSGSLFAHRPQIYPNYCGILRSFEK